MSRWNPFNYLYGNANTANDTTLIQSVEEDKDTRENYKSKKTKARVRTHAASVVAPVVEPIARVASVVAPIAGPNGLRPSFLEQTGKNFKKPASPILDDAEKCGICMEPLSTKESLKVCQNKHRFHKDCICAHINSNRNAKCPLCRESILTIVIDACKRKGGRKSSKKQRKTNKSKTVKRR
jgi:hypothetical protein